MMIAKKCQIFVPDQTTCHVRDPERVMQQGSRHLAAVKLRDAILPSGVARCSVLGAAVVWCEKKKKAFWALLLILLFS